MTDELVKRYDVYPAYHSVDVEESHVGEFVYYADHADRIEQLVATNEQLTAKLADAMHGLEKCQAELDEYSRQEYPLNHSVHERYRQRDYDANPARITLAALKGENQ